MPPRSNINRKVVDIFGISFSPPSPGFLFRTMASGCICWDLLFRWDVLCGRFEKYFYNNCTRRMTNSALNSHPKFNTCYFASRLTKYTLSLTNALKRQSLEKTVGHNFKSCILRFQSHVQPNQSRSRILPTWQDTCLGLVQFPTSGNLPISPPLRAIKTHRL